MKKFLVFAALAAMVITSCNQNKVDYGLSDGPKVKIDKAANSTYAKKVVIAGDAKDKHGYNQFEATDGGRFIIDKGTPVKADDDIDYITGTYVFADGVYTLTVNGKKFGTVKIEGNTIEFNIEGEDPVSGTVVVEDTLPSSDLVDGLAQTWIIEKIDVSIVTENKQKIGFVKTGCDLPVIAQEIMDQAKALKIDVDIDLSQLAGMKVTYLSLTSSGTLIIEFENGKVIKADVSNLDLSTGGFHYDVQADNGNEIINASADCKFVAKSATEAWLTVSIVIGDDLKGEVIFMMKKA